LAILKEKNLKRLLGQHLLETVFLGITIISVGVLIVPLWNYTQFCNALYDFSYTIPAISMNASQLTTQQTVQINFTLIATNPTPYSGLTVSSINCEIDYNGTVGLQTGWWVLTTLYITKSYTIGSNSNTAILFNTTINPKRAAQSQFVDFNNFIDYLMSGGNNGQVEWGLDCRLSLASFLSGSSITQYFMFETSLS
jgi:hypothetical protein